MPTAPPPYGILIDILMYGVYLFIALTVVSFIVGMVNGQSCCVGPKNSYEHFQDIGIKIDNHIYKSLLEMNATFDMYTQKLQNTIDETGSMKVQTCSIYNGVHDKFVKSKASEVPDTSEFQLPKNQQKIMQMNREKNAENTWKNQIELYMWQHQEKGMIDCTKVTIPKPTIDSIEEDFQDVAEGPIAPATLENLLQELQGKMQIFSKLLESPTVIIWLAECISIQGTSNYLTNYIYNVQVNAMIDKCVAKETNVPGFKDKSEKEQESITNGAQWKCNIEQMKNGPQIEDFQDYVNNEFSFPVPFPTFGMSAIQIKCYKTLSQGQDLLNKFSKMIGATYKDTVKSYRRMNNTNNTYIAYKNQIDSVSDKNYTKDQAQSFNS